MFDSGYRFKQQFIIMVSKLVLNLVLNQQAYISGSVCQLITWYRVLNLMVYLNLEILDQAKLITWYRVLNLIVSYLNSEILDQAKLITWYRVLNLIVSYLNLEILDQAKLINTLLGVVQSAIVWLSEVETISRLRCILLTVIYWHF